MLEASEFTDEFRKLAESVQGLVDEIRMRDPARMELYEERHTYVRNGLLDARKFVAICRLAQQCNALMTDAPLKFPLPAVTVLRNASAHLPFYNKIVRVARSLPGRANLDRVMPPSDSTYTYNPDDFLVYLQQLIQQMGGQLPSRFVPPDLSGVMLPAGFAKQEARRLVTEHALELLGPSSEETAIEEARDAARAYFDNTLLDLVRHAGLDDPGAGQSSLYGRMPFLQHVSLSLSGELRERLSRILGDEVVRFYRVTNEAKQALGPARELLNDARETGAPLLRLLVSATSDLRGSVLFAAAHVVCSRIARSAALGVLSADEDLARSLRREPIRVHADQDFEGYFNAQQLEVVRLTGIRSMLERAWPLMDSQQRSKLRSALTIGAEDTEPVSVTDEDFEDQRRIALAKAARDQEVKLRRELEELEKQEAEDGSSGYMTRPSAFLVPLPELVFEDRL